MKREASKSGGHCPECKRKVFLSPAKVGQFLTCPYCDVCLEVVGVSPLEFDWAYDWTREEESEEQETGSTKEGVRAMAGAFCPDCDREIRFNPHITLGQRLVCPHCDVGLEVISVDPLELDWTYAKTAKEGETIEDRDDW